MATINLKFSNKPNASLKPGDIAFYTATSNNNSFTVNSGTSKKLGVVRSIKHVSEILSDELTSSNNLLGLSTLGPELVRQGGFDVASALEAWTSTHSGWVYSSGKVKYANGTQFSKFYQQIQTEIGSVYKVQVEVSDIIDTAMNLGFSVGGSTTYYTQATFSANGTHFIYVLANATNHRVQVQNNAANGAGSFFVDNISVKKLSTPDYWIVNVDIPDNTASPAVDDYIYFSKSTQANFSGVTGYYGEITFTNNKTSAAELYSINSEVFESSK